MSGDTRRTGWLFLAVLGVGVLIGAGRAREPAPEPFQPAAALQPDPQPPPAAPPPAPPPSTAPQTPAPPVAAPRAPTGPAPGDGGPVQTTPGAQEAPRATAAPAGATDVVPVSAQRTPAVLNANDLGQLLNRTASSTGVQLQQRNAVVADPRIRGLRSYQYQLFGDNGLFFPARLDLDTPVTRFDPESVRDVIVVKGPYTVMYGPGLGAMDVATLDSPRFDRFEAHGRTGVNYQTNGERWNQIQSAWAGGPDWGFRMTYNGQQGNDYRAGNDQLIASSYLSQSANWALGMNLTPDSTVEFKGVRAYQQNVEFPGLYFDIGTQNTEAYSLRYILRDQGLFDRLTLETWYNSTTGSADTTAGAKQNFVQDLLAVSFNPGAFNQQAFDLYRSFPILTIPQAIAANPGQPLNLFRDLSTSRFATSSLGYRLFTEWGDVTNGRVLVGSDLRVTGQSLVEDIRLEQISGRNLNTGAPILPGQPPLFTQRQSIPNSNSVNPGLFASAEMPVTDRFRVRSGGRMDWMRTSTSSRLITGNIDLFGAPPAPPTDRFVLDPLVYSSNPADPNTTRHFYLLAGYLQNEYKLTDALTGVLSVGHAQRPPSLPELYASGPFVGILQQGTSRLIGDPRLQPEKMTQFDVGLQADLGRVRGGVNGFYAWINDYITFDQNKGGPGLTQVVFTNTDLATLAGGELYGTGEVTDWLTAFGTLTYVQGIDQTHDRSPRAPNLASSRRTDPRTGQYATATEPLPQIPPLETRLGLRFHDAQPDRRRWQVEVSARIVTGQNSVARSLGELPTPGFTVFNLRGFWQPAENVLLTAGVENIGDKFYREHLDPISGNILGVGPLYRPGTSFYFGSQVTY